MGAPVLTPPPGQDPNQQQDPSQVAQPPSAKKMLLGMIPFAGPLLVANAQQKYERQKEQEQQTIQGKIGPLDQASKYAASPDLDPDTRLGWQQLQADMILHNEEHYTKPYPADHHKRFQALLGQTNAQLAQKQQAGTPSLSSANAPDVPAALQSGQNPLLAGIPPPPGAAGPSGVNGTPANPVNASVAPAGALAPMPPPGVQGMLGDPFQSLIADAQSQNPIIRGRAVNMITDMRNAMVTAQALSARGVSYIDAYKQSGAEKLGIPYHQFAQTLGMEKVTAAPLVAGKPGDTIFSPTGQPLYTLPQAVSTPEGAQTNSVLNNPVAFGAVPPNGAIPSGAGVSPAIPAPGTALGNAGVFLPHGSTPGSSGAPSGPTLIASSPPRLDPDQVRSISAARAMSEKYGFPFDPNLNPRNPAAQIPTQYLTEFHALDQTFKEDPALMALRQESAADRRIALALAQQSHAFMQNLQTERRTDASRARQQSELSKVQRPIDDAAKNWSNLTDLVSMNSPMADSQIAIALVKAENAGAGSGVRITQSEINSTQGGKTQWEKLKTELGKWNPDSNKPFQFTDAQRQQVRQMARIAMDKIQRKQKIVQDANDDLLSSDEPKDHLRIVNEAKRNIGSIDVNSANNSLAGTVKMRAPNGQTSEVPADQVEHYKSKGAVVVQ